MELKKIKVGRKTIVGLTLPLQTKNLIVLRGAKGYIMCGYLDMNAADKFNDVAIKVTGVSTIEDALAATAVSVSRAAVSLGVSPGQPIREVLEIIA